jgi:hypothetical protein
METAVEWLMNELEYEDMPSWMQELFKQAKEMEKKQRIEEALKPLYLMKKLRNDHGYFGGPDNGAVIDREINNLEQQLKSK